MKCKLFLSTIILCCFVYCACAQNQLNILIKDGETLQPLAGATVTQRENKNAAISDANGRIVLNNINKQTLSLSITFIGYNGKDTIVSAQGNDPITIYLTPLVAQAEDVTVSSIRTNSRIENIPTRVEVIGQEDLEEENGIKPGNIASILGDIAGVQMQQVSASSGNTYARIEGLNGRYTQILKDGMPLFGGLSGNFSVMQIPPLDLKQIEIIKGSASTLYGGDAIGGIINLISKNPSAKPELTITANRTTLTETNFNGYYSNRFNKTGITVFAAQTFQKATDVDKDGLSDVPYVNSTVVHPKLIFYFNKKSTLTLNYTGTFDARDGGNMQYFPGKSNDTLYHVNSTIKRHNADANWLYNFSANSNLNVKFSTSYFNQTLFTNAYLFKADQLIFYSEISYVHKSQKADWVAGININGDNFNNTSNALNAIKNYSYQTFGAFIQNTWRPLNKLTIETGLRADIHSKYGLFPLPRLSFLYKFNNEFSARLNGGFGYKIPTVISYVDAETDLNKIILIKELNEELSQSINADINYHKLFFNKLNVVINQSFFFTNLKHPVYDSSSTINYVTLINANKSLQTAGSQTYTRIEYNKMELYLSYVYTNVKQLYDDVHPQPVVTPKHNFAATFLYEFNNNFKIGIESSVIGGQLNQNYQPVKTYTLITLMAQYNIDKFSFVLNGENLLNFRQSRYEKIYDGTINNPVFHKLWAPVDGRVINFSVKWSL